MIKIKVPCSSANFGPGFDSIGVALNLYNTFSICEIESGHIIDGCPLEFQTADNIVYKAMEIVFKKVNYTPSGIKILIESDIPISKGLGSSSSCIIGGMVAANYLSGNKLSKEDLINLATKMEGHPDNVIPCFLGGFIVSFFDGEKTYYEKIPFESYVDGPNFIVEVKNIPTFGHQLTVNCKGQDIEIDAVRLVNEDIEGIISDLQIKTEQKDMIDKIMFSDLSIRKKRIAVRRLQNKKLERKFIQLCLKLLEYVEISDTGGEK